MLRNKELIPIVFRFGGLLFFVVGVSWFYHVHTIAKTYKPVTAKIEHIEKYYSKSHGDKATRISYDVTVSYRVGDSTYLSPLSYYYSGMRVGKNIELMYDPADPSEVEMPEVKKIAAILFAVGGLIFVAVSRFVRRLENDTE